MSPLFGPLGISCRRICGMDFLAYYLLMQIGIEVLSVQSDEKIPDNKKMERIFTGIYNFKKRKGDIK